MIVKVISATVLGIEAHRVEVEVDLAPGLPQFSTVGLPDAAVRESRDRIRAAIKNAGYPFPRHHITINLAPADIRKEGAGFDLPIAAGILAAQDVLRPEILARYLVMGELSLDGAVKPVQGILPAAFAARDGGIPGIMAPEDNAREAALAEGLEVIPVGSLADVVDFCNGQKGIPALSFDPAELFRDGRIYPIDFKDIRGQDQAKRALEIAAAGAHHLLMVGPPGAGKTMLAERLPTILPDLSLAEAVETTKVYSVAGLLDRTQVLVARRPFRAPHHTISDAGLVGGGQNPRPGEISLAHHGVLFLDEFPEFRKNALEALRQPLESGSVTIARSAQSATYPSRFMLVAAMNPCPCGYFGESGRTCRCSPLQVRQYQNRISGPLLDRIDIHIEIPSVRYRDLAGRYAGESSAAIRERVGEARLRQRRRFGTAGAEANARMANGEIKAHCPVDDEGRSLLEMAMERLGLSARAYMRVLKVSRTIADLAGEERIRPRHVAEAIQYRSLESRRG